MTAFNPFDFSNTIWPILAPLWWVAVKAVLFISGVKLAFWGFAAFRRIFWGKGGLR